MKTHRRNGKVVISLLPNKACKINISRTYSEKNDECLNLFQYGKYLIRINQSKAVKLCQIPDLKHEDVFIFSLEETRPLLKHLNMSESGFDGKIIYQHNIAGNFTPIIIISFDKIIKSIKRKGVRSIKREILCTFSHEIRHAEQYQKNLFPLNGFWKFVQRYRNTKQRLSMKNEFVISGVMGLLAGLLWFVSRHLFWIEISFLMMFSLFDLAMMAVIKDSLEKDAESFAQEAIQDKRWRECVKLVKIEKNKKELKKEPQ